ncbi:MAG TPA: phosphopantetheine-binding protein [Nitrospiraceae bacterium]|nr:phosphopantetheine-binding protein [Nitrospiraceae bacterium]
MSNADEILSMSPAHQALWRSWAEKRAAQDTPQEHLVAFVVEKAGTSVDPQDLQLFLNYRLPAYMVPSQIVKVPQLPRTSGGKLDRPKLSMLKAAGADPPKKIAPRNELERRLVGLFEQVLNHQPVGVFDDFFADLGGHSLLATKLVWAMRREWNRDIPLRLLFENPTVAGMAQALSITAVS